MTTQPPLTAEALRQKRRARKGWRNGIKPGTPEWSARYNNWICQCSDTTVVNRGERCPHCGKTEQERA